nr:heat shock factor protein 1 [Misgurnus anguillicaudatus]
MKQTHTVPSFVSKLWALVEAPSTNHLICWSKDGCSFLVQDEQQFSKEVLPLYFKHSNMTSFVRQLNMYGFHKVVQMDAGLPKAEQVDCAEFQHEYFRKAQPHLLGLIRRKVSVSRGNEDGGQVSQVLVQVSHVKGWQDSSDLKLMALCRDNESLWRELDSLRQKYQQQHKVIRKIIRFIINSVQSNRIKGCKRRLPMIDSSEEHQSAPKYSRSLSVKSTNNSSAFHELDVSPADVYTHGTVISDITHLLDPTPEPHKEIPELPTTLSTFLSPDSSALPSMDLALSFLDELDPQQPKDVVLERNDVYDPLALIDSSLAAIHSYPQPFPELDNFSKILSPGCHISAVKDSETERKQQAQSEADKDIRQRTLDQDVGLEEELFDGGDYSDILTSILQLAQESSSLSFNNTSLPLEPSMVI